MKTAQVIGTLGVGIVVGAAAALLIKGTPPPPIDPCLIPGPHTIEVSNNGRVSCPTVVVRPGDRITWHSPTGTKLMAIHLQATNLGQPACPPTGSTPTNLCDYPTPSAATSTQTDYDGTLTGGSPDPAPLNARIIIQR